MSTLVLVCVLCVRLSTFMTSHRCPGHERAHWCSLVSWASLSLPLQHGADTQGTSEHTGARSCSVSLFYYLFDTVDAQDMSEHTGARSYPVSLLFSL